MPKTARSAQTQTIISFIWIVWSILCVYLWATLTFIRLKATAYQVISEYTGKKATLFFKYTGARATRFYGWFSTFTLRPSHPLQPSWILRHIPVQDTPRLKTPKFPYLPILIGIPHENDTLIQDDNAVLWRSTVPSRSSFDLHFGYLHSMHCHLILNWNTFSTTMSQ